MLRGLVTKNTLTGPCYLIVRKKGGDKLTRQVTMPLYSGLYCHFTSVYLKARLGEVDFFFLLLQPLKLLEKSYVKSSIYKSLSTF